MTRRNFFVRAAATFASACVFVKIASPFSKWTEASRTFPDLICMERLREEWGDRILVRIQGDQAIVYLHETAMEKLKANRQRGDEVPNCGQCGLYMKTKAELAAHRREAKANGNVCILGAYR